MVKILTQEVKRRIVRLDMDALAKLVAQAMGEKSYRDAAADWGLTPQTLFNVANGRTRHPSEEVLEAISNGADIPYETLALAAYGIIRPSVATAAASA